MPFVPNEEILLSKDMETYLSDHIRSSMQFTMDMSEDDALEFCAKFEEFNSDGVVSRARFTVFW